MTLYDLKGDFVHKKVDDPFFNEKRKDIHNSRSVPVFSDKCVIYGIADIINDSEEKENRWKEEWEGFYPDSKENYLLI